MGNVAETEVTFGALLRRIRTERGLSLAALAASTHYNKGYLSRIENGQRAASAELAERLDAALAAGGVLLALATAERNSCPYRGLAAFRPQDAALFFGREQATAELLQRLLPRHQRNRDHAAGDGPTVVVAPSGAGKSSLLRAGLLPALARGALAVPGSARWPALLLTPTADPGRELTERLAETLGTAADGLRRALAAGPDQLTAAVRDALPGPDARLVLVVDQFEELFTLCAAETERRAYLAALASLSSLSPLTTLTSGEQPPALVVIGVRADFYGRCLSYPQLVAAVQHGQFALGPMTEAELVEAITRPAAAAGLTLEAGLVDVVLRDLGIGPGTGHDPGALPLLSHALLTTWQQRDSSTLTLAGYRLVGGIRGAVATTAEQAYTQLTEDQRLLARQLLLRLVRVGDSDQDTRRRLDRDQLLAALTGATEATGPTEVLEAFAAARLVTLDADRVEITHEALLRAWPRLRGWIEEDREELRGHQQLTEAATGWERAGQDPSLLYRGARLEQAAAWAAQPRLALTALDHRFVQAGLEQRDRQHALEAARGRRLRRLVAGLSALVLLAVAATGYALTERADVLAQRDIAVARDLGDQADRLRHTDTSLAARLSLAAYRIADTARSRGALVASSSHPRATLLTGHRYAVNTLAHSADGRLLATGGDDPELRLWDTSDPSRPTPAGRWPLPAGGVLAAAVTADRVHAVLADGTAYSWPLRGRSAPVTTRVSPGPVAAAALTSGAVGRLLAVAGTDGTVRLWRPETSGRFSALGQASGAGSAHAVAFSPNGRLLAVAGADAELRLWTVDPARPGSLTEAGTAIGHLGAVRTLAFADSGRTLVSGGDDETVRLWDVTAPDAPTPGRVLSGHGGPVRSVAVSPDGRTLASGGDDQTVWCWDLAGGAVRSVLYQPTPVRAVTFAPEGGALVTGEVSAVVRRWQLPAPVLTGHTGAVAAVAFAHGADLLASGGADATVRLWPTTPGQSPTQVLPAGTGPVYTVALSGQVDDSALLAAAGDNGRFQLWHRSGQGRGARYLPAATVPAHASRINRVAFHPQRRLLATASSDRTVRLWDLTDPARPTPLTTLSQANGGHTNFVWGLAFSPDGQLLATVGEDYKARLWDVSRPGTTRLVSTLVGHFNGVNAVAFHPGGRLLATASSDRTVRLWDLADPGSPVLRTTLTGHASHVEAVGFSPDGRLLASTSTDATVRLWELAPDGDGPPVTMGSLTAHSGAVRGLAFAPTGSAFVTSGEDRLVRFWDRDAAAVADRLGQPAGSGLTEEEQGRYLPGDDYRDRLDQS